MSSRNRLYKRKDISRTLTEENKNINNNDQEHPLDFYALGKVKNCPKYIPNFSPNRAFYSTSNDLITRNIFSLNTKKYDNLKNNKNFSALSQQNIDENNYLKPLEIFKTYKKSNLPSNAINTATYNIAKEKIFTKSNISLIKKGNNLTFNTFMDYKKNAILNLKRNNNKSANDEKIKEKNLQRINTESNYNYINKNREIKKKYGFSHDNFTEFNKPIIQYINPIDYSKQKLKNNTFYFDKNNQQFLKHKNWWIPDK